MGSSSPQLPTSQGPRRRTGQARLNVASKALLWVAVIVLAVSPWPWW
jgi:hypothetical protein